MCGCGKYYHHSPVTFSSATSFLFLFFSPWKLGAKDRRHFWSTFESRINASEMPKVTPLTKHGVVSNSCFLTSHSRPKILSWRAKIRLRFMIWAIKSPPTDWNLRRTSVGASNNSKKRRRFAIQRVTFGPKTALDFCPINSNRGLGGEIDGFISFERLSQSIKSWKSVRTPKIICFFFLHSLKTWRKHPNGTGSVKRRKPKLSINFASGCFH